MIVRYSPLFLEILKKVDVRISKSFKTKIAIFYQDPTDPRLDNHPLKRQWQGHRSIDITADWRAIYNEIQEEDQTVAYFVAIGTHKDLYSLKTKPITS